MAGLVVIILYACKLAFLASSTCVKIIECLLKNDARKAYLRVHKRIIIMPTIYERDLKRHNEIKAEMHTISVVYIGDNFQLNETKREKITDTTSCWFNFFLRA